MWMGTAYARAIAELEGARRRPESVLSCRPSPYLNNVMAGHRIYQEAIAASLWSGAEGALRTIDGYEAMHLIRRADPVLPKGDVVGQTPLIQTHVWHRRHKSTLNNRRSFTVARPYLQRSLCSFCDRCAIGSRANKKRIREILVIV